MTVATAAPAMPIFGNPQSPKMRSALKIIFAMTDAELIIELFAANPQFFMTLKYICEMLVSRNESAT